MAMDTERVADTTASAADGSESAADRIVQPAFVDPRPRWRRMAAPGAAAVAAGAALGYVAAVDPNEPGHYPLCPSLALFGIDCPGCGLTRSTHALLTGDLSGALDHNVLIVAVVPLAVVLWLLWVRRAWTGRRPAVTAHQQRRRTTILIVTLVALLAFGVVRNFVPYLGSGIG